MSSSPSISLIAAFCKELREAREYRQMTLNEVARATRISVEFLQALESARWDQIPRAYLRGYLGLYAFAVGMNREKVLRSFDHIVAPSTGRPGAVLEEAPPLLQAPEHVGVTRAKIRTAWFAALSQNRRTAYTVDLSRRPCPPRSAKFYPPRPHAQDPPHSVFRGHRRKPLREFTVRC